VAAIGALQDAVAVLGGERGTSVAVRSEIGSHA
jgi:hypothetical protein